MIGPHKELYSARSDPRFEDVAECSFAELDYLLSLCITNACSYSWHHFVSLQYNCTEFLNEQIHHFSLIVMVCHTSLKLTSLPSVDKICPVRVLSDTAFSLCFINSSYRLTKCFCSLTIYVLSSLQSAARGGMIIELLKLLRTAALELYT